MKNKFYLSILFCLFFGNGFGQEIVWQKAIGGSGYDVLESILQTADGGFVIGASSSSNVSGDKSENNWDSTLTTNDYWVIKLDSLGNIQWQRTIGGIGQDFLSDISFTSDGGYIIGGRSNSPISGDKTENSCNNAGYYDYWILKLDALGNIQWQNTIGSYLDETVCAVFQTTNNSYIIGGYSISITGCDKSYNNGVSHGANDYWIVKIDSLGNIIWENTIGGPSWTSETLTSFGSTTDGGFFAGGIFDCKQFAWKFFEEYQLTKFNSAGAIQWNVRLGSNKSDRLYCAKELPGIGYVCGGSSNSDDSTQKSTPCYGSNDYWIVMTNTAGVFLNSYTIGGDNTDDLAYLYSTNDLGFICGGTSLSTMSGNKSENNNGGKDEWIVKLDSIGNIQWQNTVGGNGDDYLKRVFPSSDGKSFICAGTSYSGISGDKTENSKGGCDIWLFKLKEHDCFITGNMFFDTDSNSVKDSAELFASYRRVNLLGSNLFSYTDYNGNYKIRVPDSGNYSIAPATIQYYKSEPQIETASFNGIPQTDSLNNFAIQTLEDVKDLKISITPYSAFRSNQNASYKLYFENVGKTILISQVVFYLSDSNYTYVTSSIAPSLITTDSVIWNNITLSPFQSGSIIVTVHLNAGLPIGTQINSVCLINPFIGDSFPGDNYGSWKVFTVGSYDPNNILVDEDTLTTPQLAASPYLNYVINFQNTGNDTAFTVKLLNPIDTNRLDLNTLEYVASSHPLIMNYIPWERNMEFKFDNILLPDSNINEPMSHGFIRYRIKPKTTLIPTDSINNFANIYFDYNLPVRTNDAITRILLPNIYIYLNDTVCESFVSPSGNYTWTTSGTYLDTIPAGIDLDSVFTVRLIVNKTFAVFNDTACYSYLSPSGNYLWTTTGSYLDTLINVAGCDSIITINLKVNKSSSTINQNACESFVSPSGKYTWTTSGIYNDTIPNAAGCDSAITFNLAIYNQSVSSINPDVCNSYVSPSGKYDWTSSGNYLDTIPNANGCDSIININLIVRNSSTSFFNVIECDKYLSPSGAVWTTTGIYNDTIQNYLGCDSVISIDLIINPSVQVNSETSICNGDSAFLSGSWQTTAGVYYDTLQTVFECDSTITTQLTIEPFYNSTNTISICAGDSSFIGGSWQTQQGNYIDNLQTTFGCDSIITTQLIVNPVFNSSNIISICNGDSVFIGGSWLTQQGTYIENYLTPFGCDSIITTQLIVNPVFSSNNNISICNGDSIFLSGSWQTTQGNYMENLQTTFGCDSIIETALSVNPVFNSTDTINIFQGDSVFAGGAWQTVAGVYTDNYLSQNGCDSVVITVLNILTGINTINNSTLISIKPNPSSGFVTIEFSGSSKSLSQLSLNNLQGQLIMQDEIKSHQPKQINISSIAKGVYILKITSDKKNYYSKLVKE